VSDEIVRAVQQHWLRPAQNDSSKKREAMERQGAGGLKYKRSAEAENRRRHAAGNER
jgi:hypothetical protein